MSIKPLKTIKTELLHLIRNADVLTITERNVTTATDTGTFSADSSYILTGTQIKNIRSIVVDGVTLDYGTDYLYNVDYDNSGTKACQITFTNSQTGDYTITYDYGNDRIFPDFPSYYLKLNQFPRIHFDILTVEYTPASIGYCSEHGEFIVQLNVYTHNDHDKIETVIASVIDLIKSNSTDSYSFEFATDFSIGSVLVSPFSNDKIMQRNLDFNIKTFYEE